MYFDMDGYLISCSDMDNELWKFDENANHTVLLSSEEGNLFNGPNDVWVRLDGGMFLTDPLYNSEYWDSNQEMQRYGEYVYFFHPYTNRLLPVFDSIIMLNGNGGHTI